MSMSATPTALDTLARCGLFRGLSPESRHTLAQIGVMRSFSRGDRIFAQGQECPGMFVMARGLVRVFKVSPTGKDHVLHFAEPGRTFAEVAVLGDFPCPANAEAAEDSEALLLPKPELHALLRRNHALCLELLGGMALWVHQLVGLLEDLVLRDASGRVASHLLSASAGTTAPSFVLRVLKKDLASHLNLTSETLSRTLRRLADASLIELRDGQRIAILDRERLAAVAAGMAPAEFEGRG